MKIALSLGVLLILFSCSHLSRKHISVIGPHFLDGAKERCSYGDGRSCYLSGLLLAEKDQKKSLGFFRRGCSLSDGRSCFNLGILLRELESEIKGMELIRRSCLSFNDIFSCFYLGNLLGAENPEGHSFLKKSCEEDYTKSCYSLAVYYKNEGKLEDSEHYFRQACDINHKESCRSLLEILNESGNEEERADLMEKIQSIIP